ncbi:MAG: hypothetical protein ASARMPREDX12_002959 [Alectoria sarmentosa]|nr:MAG: hypothetical protein ASARMPREDX12_002959 [Alectoria sarmentosa]
MYTTPLFLLALGTAALALPPPNSSLIEKRSSRPWLTSFDGDDAVCQDPTGDTGDDPRDFIQASDCVVFQPAEQRVGGSWGAGGFGIGSFTAFENADCTGAVKAVITRKDGEHGFCFLLSALGCQQGETEVGTESPAQRQVAALALALTSEGSPVAKDPRASSRDEGSS